MSRWSLSVGSTNRLVDVTACFRTSTDRRLFPACFVFHGVRSEAA
jgi:hypothetical protein